VTTVVNIKSGEPWDVYIGRTEYNQHGAFVKSKWANPYKIGTHGTRQQVIDRYRTWIEKQPELMNALRQLKDKRLGCWCKPAACHGDVLIELVEAL
jgi:hypothetical protein